MTLKEVWQIPLEFVNRFFWNKHIKCQGTFNLFTKFFITTTESGVITKKTPWKNSERKSSSQAPLQILSFLIWLECCFLLYHFWIMHLFWLKISPWWGQASKARSFAPLIGTWCKYWMSSYCSHKREVIPTGIVSEWSSMRVAYGTIYHWKLCGRTSLRQKTIFKNNTSCFFRRK